MLRSDMYCEDGVCRMAAEADDAKESVEIPSAKLIRFTGNVVLHDPDNANDTTLAKTHGTSVQRLTTISAGTWYLIRY